MGQIRHIIAQGLWDIIIVTCWAWVLADKKNATWRWREHICQWHDLLISLQNCNWQLPYFAKYELFSSELFSSLELWSSDTRQTDAKWCISAHRAYAQVCSKIVHSTSTWGGNYRLSLPHQSFFMCEFDMTTFMRHACIPIWGWLMVIRWCVTSNVVRKDCLSVNDEYDVERIMQNLQTYEEENLIRVMMLRQIP